MKCVNCKKNCGSNMLSKHSQTDKVFDTQSELAAEHSSGLSLPKVKKALSEKQKIALANLHAKNAEKRAQRQSHEI